MNLDARSIRHHLAEIIGSRLAADWDIRIKPETVSTNDDALILAEQDAPENTVIFAESQSAGRGRRGDTWVSPPGVNLLFSILLRPHTTVGTWTRIPHLAGLAVCRALESSFPTLPRPMLKWPNDIYLDDRKLAGILVESRACKDQAPAAVLGIGLNVNLLPEQLPDEIRTLATTLRSHTGHLIERNALAAAILAEWSALYPAELITDFAIIREELRRRAWLKGRKITVVSGNRQISGNAIDVGPEGELVVETESGALENILSADRVIW
ncbi:MAG: biotin--[acetyl-CoA-carboxylase] ligase [Verrucomicrobiae bacterium]|nr:biotin--[acetyl-CoA-carboxylase] ligase [Verrucomicrobiae bacterium]